MKHEQPNIFLIILDTFRADKVFFSHRNSNLTPFMEKILNNSIYFKNCISNSPWTVPSHISMFSGLYPSQNRQYSQSVNCLSKKLPTLAEILSNNGYNTVCFTENAYISNNYGLNRGFTHYFENYSNYLDKEADIPIVNFFTKIISKINLLKKKKKGFIYILNVLEKIVFLLRSLLNIILWFKIVSHIIVQSNKTPTHIKNTLLKVAQFPDKSKPLFFYLNIMVTHDPYIPLFELFSEFNITRTDFKKLRKILLSTAIMKYKINLFSKKIRESKVSILKRLYNSCVLSDDRLIEKIFSSLNDSNLLQDAIIILTSDHGEFLGGKQDHYLWEHNTLQSVNDALLKVPLIIFNSNYSKRIVNDQVQLKDLFHTILDLSQVNGAELEYFKFEESLVYQIQNNSTPKYIFGEYPKSKVIIKELFNKYQNQLDRNKIYKIYSDIFFVRSENYKLIRYGKKKEELYDLSSDPHEEKNVLPRNVDEYESLQSFMETKLNEISNQNNLKKFITSKEKDIINKSISAIKRLIL